MEGFQLLDSVQPQPWDIGFKLVCSFLIGFSTGIVLASGAESRIKFAAICIFLTYNAFCV